MKDSIMNSKFLYVATVAVSLLSTLAMADEGAVSRTQVKAELSKAIATGTLQRTDYDADRSDAAARSTQTRDQVIADMAAAKADRKRLKQVGVGRYALQQVRLVVDTALITTGGGKVHVARFKWQRPPRCARGHEAPCRREAAEALPPPKPSHPP